MFSARDLFILIYELQPLNFTVTAYTVRCLLVIAIALLEQGHAQIIGCLGLLKHTQVFGITM